MFVHTMDYERDRKIPEFMEEGEEGCRFAYSPETL